MGANCASHVVVLEMVATSPQHGPSKMAIQPLVALPFEGSCFFMAESRLASSLVVVVDSALHLLRWSEAPVGCSSLENEPYSPYLEKVHTQQTPNCACLTAFDLCQSSDNDTTNSTETIVVSKFLGGLLAYKVSPYPSLGLTMTASNCSIVAPMCSMLRILSTTCQDHHEVAAFDNASKAVLVFRWVDDECQERPIATMEVVFKWHLEENICRLVTMEPGAILAVGIRGDFQQLGYRENGEREEEKRQRRTMMP